MSSFANRLRERIAAHSPLCVGIDPSAALLQSCQLPNTAAGALAFGQRVLEAANFELSIVKPQSAFFERFGSQGVRALEELTAQAQARGVLVPTDGKRGDIDTTATAYAEGYFSGSAPVTPDAVTTHAYLGLGAMRSFFDLAVKHGAGVFVVVRSSNPEGRALQTARLASGETVARHLCREITEFNRQYAGDDFAPIGAVVGATCDDAAPMVGALPNAFILAPGVGAQGATMQDVLIRMPGARGRVLPNVSRAILANGSAPADIRTTIRVLQQQAQTLL